MSDKPPSIQEWKELYDVAIEFKKIECWDWMWDSDIFGVQDPESGEIGYCYVMGRLGEHFGLGVSLGTEGLEGYLKIQSGEISPATIDALHSQKCLTASFKDRRFLQKQDLQIIKKSGLKFRGRNSWPVFRSYLPGYHPWYLTSDEVKYLTLALYQVIDVSLRCKNDPEMLAPPTENHYLVRVPKKERDGLKWKDKWLEPSPLEKTKIVAEPLDEHRLEKIKRTITQPQGVWEIDFFYSPHGVSEKGERPYYPYMILWVEHYSGLILKFHIAETTEYKSEFVEQFLNSLENIESLPKEILVKKEETFKLFEPITSKLGIKLRRVKRLIALEEAQDGMFEFFVE